MNLPGMQDILDKSPLSALQSVEDIFENLKWDIFYNITLIPWSSKVPTE